MVTDPVLYCGTQVFQFQFQFEFQIFIISKCARHHKEILNGQPAIAGQNGLVIVIIIRVFLKSLI